MQSRRTKALAISKEVKEKVWERDGHRCVWCGSSNASPEAHYISRAHSGLGIEENILTLCRECHRRYDLKHPDHEYMKDTFKTYLKSIYPDWDEDNLVYRR